MLGRRRNEEDDHIPTFDESARSIQDRDKDYSRKVKEHRKKMNLQTSKAYGGLALEQENNDLLEKTLKEIRRGYLKHLDEMSNDMRSLIVILLKHPEIMDGEDLKIIDKIKEKLNDLIEEG